MAVLSYAYYRLPYADTYTLAESEREPLRLDSLEEIGSVPGFALVPFQPSQTSPSLLILPDSITTRQLMPSPEESVTRECFGTLLPDSRYATAFETFHRAVSDGDFLKLVLARSRDISVTGDPDPADPVSMRPVFERACRLYPRLMVMLYSTPASGTWLVASPEILLDGKGRSLHTVALAGTMQFSEGHIDWSPKNKQEQNIVEKYMETVLSEVSNDVLKDGPVTVRAGNLVHLRTDFRFHLDPCVTLGSLVGRLHPTPAVCGMPKLGAAEFIAANEGMDRRYYSGFAGPVDILGETHLYVALRCASLSRTEGRTSATMYAGGGIMPGSDCQSEWQETESKMRTIRYVLQ